MMEYELFARLYQEAAQYGDIDMYIAERGWQDWMDDYVAEDSIDASKASAILKNIFDLSKMTIKDIREQIKPTRAEFCRAYYIPVPTVRDWETENREMADYIKMFIAYTAFVIFFNREVL